MGENNKAISMALKTELITEDDEQQHPEAQPEEIDGDELVDQDSTTVVGKRQEQRSGQFRGERSSNDRYNQHLMNTLVLGRQEDLRALLGVSDDLMTGASEIGSSRMTEKRVGCGESLRLDLGFDPYEEQQRMSSADLSAAHPLFEHGVCKWPGCEVSLSDLGAFVRYKKIRSREGPKNLV